MSRSQVLLLAPSVVAAFTVRGDQSKSSEKSLFTRLESSCGMAVTIRLYSICLDNEEELRYVWSQSWNLHGSLMFHERNPWGLSESRFEIDDHQQFWHTNHNFCICMKTYEKLSGLGASELPMLQQCTVTWMLSSMLRMPCQSRT
jgi:hypothetical protein